MPDMTPRRMSEAIREGLEEAAMLVALGYEASLGRPSPFVPNNALELRGYGRPIPPPHPFRPQEPFPDEWIRIIAQAVTGRPDATPNEVAAMLRKTPRPV
jgi:hypothetical protein